MRIGEFQRTKKYCTKGHSYSGSNLILVKTKKTNRGRLCRTCRTEWARLSQESLKPECLNAYGGPICVCCKERVIEFLSIDHIKGGGNKHKQQRLKAGKNVSLYLWLKKNGFPKGFRVLCMNCNFATKHGKQCPHQKENAK